jgi:tripartite-type tricarboxylate transporter receptor subunit TctC
MNALGSLGRRAAAAGTVLCLTGLLAGPVLHAQDAFPNRPIRVVTPFPPGSSNDVIPRLVAARLSERLGQSVIVDNRSGGGGMVGTETVVRAMPDGYTLLVGTSSGMVMNVGLYKKLPFDVERDLVPVVLLTRTNLAMLANPGAPGSSLQEFVAYAKANPGKLSYGSGGNGSISHIVPENLKRILGIDILHVPYRGNGPAMVDLVAGRIHVVFGGLLGAAQLIENRSLKVYAVGGTQRSAAYPAIPTFHELGVKDLDPYTWNGLLAPAGTPRAVLERLNRETNAVLREPELRQAIEKRGSDVIQDSTLKSTADFVVAERARWVPLVRSLNLSLD